jgi:hypothetical protein
MEIYDLRRPPVVGVPNADVSKILVSWFYWMAGNYVGYLGTKMASLRSACLNT